MLTDQDKIECRVQDLSPDSDDYHQNMMEIFNWIHEYISVTELKEEVANFLENSKRKFNDIKHIDAYHFITIGKHAWVINRGGMLSEKSIDFFQNKLEKLLKKYVPQPVIVKSKPDIYYYVLNEIQDSEFLEHINIPNHVLDVLNKYIPTKGIINRLKRHFKKCKQEVQSKNVECQEYYRHLSQEEKSQLKRSYDIILQSFEMYDQNKKAMTTQRTRSSARKAKSTSNFKYKQNDQTLGVISIKPESIIGCQALLVFDTKNKRLMLLKAENDKKGLTISGSTVKGLSNESFAKTSRSPEKDLVSLSSSNYKRTEMILNEYVKGKKYSCTGRITQNMILLKSF